MGSSSRRGGVLGAVVGGVLRRGRGPDFVPLSASNPGREMSSKLLKLAFALVVVLGIVVTVVSVHK